MAVCTTMTPILTEKSSQCYHYSPINDLRDIYQTSLKQYFNIDISNPFQLVQRLARSLSVEGIIPMPNNHSKTYTRTNSLYIHHQKKEFPFKSIENDLDFQVIPEENDKRHYSTKTPYPCPSNECILSSPPMGYKPICIQLLARHGSRSLNGHDYDMQIIKIWQLAKENNLLTLLGEQLKEDIELFMEENNCVG